MNILSILAEHNISASALPLDALLTIEDAGEIRRTTWSEFVLDNEEDVETLESVAALLPGDSVVLGHCAGVVVTYGVVA